MHVNICPPHPKEHLPPKETHINPFVFFVKLVFEARVIKMRHEWEFLILKNNNIKRSKKSFGKAA